MGEADTPKSDLQHRVAVRIRRVRRRQRLTQEQVATRLAIALRNYQRLESGTQNLTLKTVERVAEALGVDVGELVDAVPSLPPGELLLVGGTGDAAPRPVPVFRFDDGVAFAIDGRGPAPLGWTLVARPVAAAGHPRPFVARVDDPAMAPTIPLGCWSAFGAADVGGELALTDGDVGVFRPGPPGEGAAAVVRRVRRTDGRTLLVADDPATPALDLPASRRRCVARWLGVVGDGADPTPG
jgi:HTH-type transcriptional regulator/antitoxin HipB